MKVIKLEDERMEVIKLEDERMEDIEARGWGILKLEDGGH